MLNHFVLLYNTNKKCFVLLLLVNYILSGYMLVFSKDFFFISCTIKRKELLSFLIKFNTVIINP